MKRTFGKYFLAGGLLLAAPATILAQKAAQPGNKNKEVQQIIITRNSGEEKKTVIEINGDQVTINGKDVKDLKDQNINININRLKDVDALVEGPRGSVRFRSAPTPPRAMNVPRNFNFEMNDEGFDFFREDSSRAMLGVVTAADEKGALVNDVSKESGAEKAGLKKGDIITRIDNEKIAAPDDVAEAVRKHKPGDKITVTVLRDGKEQKINAELSKWKGMRVNAENFRVMVPGRVTPFEPNDRFDLREFNIGQGGQGRVGLSVQDTENGKGVVVQDVEEGSNAEKAGIKEGDIINRFNDTEVTDVNLMRRLLASARNSAAPVKVGLLRNGKQQTVELRVRKLQTADL